MLGRIAVAALVAGAVAGVFFWAAHMVKVVPLVIQAEVYEDQTAGGHSHAAEASANARQAASEQPAAAEEEWGPAEGFERAAYTLMADLLLSIGFAFILCAAFALSGRAIDWREGAVWGIVAFAAVYVSPALGLAPELPGMQAGDLHARQTWWLATAAAGAAGFALVFLARPSWLRLGGAILILLPHLVGAPTHELQAGPVPAELAAQFAVASLSVTGLFWVVLGGCAGYAYNRMQKA